VPLCRLVTCPLTFYLSRMASTDSPRTKPRDCVYTVLTGDYEILNEQPIAANSDWEFICLTDSATLRSDSWQIRRVPLAFEMDPIRSQRILKILPHDCLGEFDRSLYIDNTVILRAEPEAIQSRCFSDADLGLFVHSFRASLEDEFLEVAQLGLDDQMRVLEQLNHYALLWPDLLEQRPYWSGMLWRDHRSLDVRCAMEHWRNQVLRYSRRDQLSLNLALRIAGVTPTLIHHDNQETWYHQWPRRNSRRNGPERQPLVQLAPLRTSFAALQTQLDKERATVVALSHQVRQLRDEQRFAVPAVQVDSRPRRFAPWKWVKRRLRRSKPRPETVAAPAVVVPPRPAALPLKRTGATCSFMAPRGMREFFDQHGYYGPVRVFTEDQCRFVLRHHRQGLRQPSSDWPKDLALVDRFFYELSRRPQITSMLRELLGEDVVLWGASIIERTPGQKHPFHTDIESSGPAGGCVSIWIGLENTVQESALALISHSQRVGRTIQQEIHERGAARDQIQGETALAWARESVPESRLVQPAMGNGEAILFDGRLWHGSDNKGTHARSALLLQYARSGAKIPIQETGNTTWPFRLTGRMAPQVLVCGQDRSRTTLPPPTGNPAEAVPVQIAARSACDYQPVPAGWGSYHILHGPTPNASAMESHVSVLSPGHSPHPPHAHAEEELLIVLKGEAEILTAENGNPHAAKVTRVSVGAVAYYPAFQYHTIRNASAAPLVYLMYKWQGPPREVVAPLETVIVEADGFWAETQRAISMNLVFESPTGYLEKLHAHATEIKPGQGYPAHRDRHDVAIIVFAGEVETLGKRLGPGGSAYCAAGIPHGLKSIGNENARYLVFEFHGG
jgi:quercetin dioxygenase-like cupin family protein